MKFKTLGNLGENFAEEFLIAKGYRILQRNYSCKFGEIDIVAMKNETIYFVEVKTRQSVQFGYPAEAITKKKRKSMERSAMYYLDHSKFHCSNYEFKVVEIMINDFNEIAI